MRRTSRNSAKQDYSIWEDHIIELSMEVDESALMDLLRVKLHEANYTKFYS